MHGGKGVTSLDWLNSVQYIEGDMGVQERRAREKDEVRRRILTAASELFVNEGIGSVSMRKIAEKVEYSPAAIYLYFKDKSELVFSICQETFSELDARLAAVERRGAFAGRGIYAGVRDLRPVRPRASVALHHHALHTGGSWKQSETILVLGMKAFDHLRQCVRRCVESGAFRGGDIEALAQMCWLSIHGLTAGLVTSCRFPSVDREILIKTHLETLARGLRA